MENSLLKSDIFFFVTTICVVVVTILAAVALIYGIKIFRDLKVLVEKAKEEGQEILSDVRETRMALKEKSNSMLALIFSFLAQKAVRRKRKED